MAHVISDACVSCGACEATCPVEAISAGDTQYQVDAVPAKMLARPVQSQENNKHIHKAAARRKPVFAAAFYFFIFFF